MSAKEMFKELDYELKIEPIINGGRFDNGYYHIYTKETSSECDNYITYFKDEIIIGNEIGKDKFVLLKRYINDEVSCDETFYLGQKEIEAIQQQIKELKWGE